MKARKLPVAAALAILAGCGGGSAIEEAPSADADASSPAAAQDSTNTVVTPPARSAGPVPSTSPSPSPAPAPAPIAAPSPAPIAAPDEPETISGRHLAAMMTFSTVRGPQPTFSAVGDPNGATYGTVFAMQNPANAMPAYNYQYATAGGGCTSHSAPCPLPNPNWFYKTLAVRLGLIVNGVDTFFSDYMQAMVDNGATQGSDQYVDLIKSGGFTIRPTDKYQLDTTVAQWNARNGDPYFVQMQTGLYNGYVRNCWHVRLPGVQRQACMLFDKPSSDDAAIVHRGDYISDDSNSNSQSILFLSLL